MFIMFSIISLIYSGLEVLRDKLFPLIKTPVLDPITLILLIGQQVTHIE